MSETTTEWPAMKRKADAVLESAARDLQEILVALARAAEPMFPYFPSSDLRLIEVEPGANAGPNMGFVALCPDGQLYELNVGFDLDPLTFGHTHKLKELNLPPADYVVYAHTAICQVTEILRGADRRKAR